MARENLGAAPSVNADLVRLVDVPELAQDAVGTILADSSRIDLTYNDATPSVTADIITDSVGNTFLSNMADSTIKGRAVGAGTGDPTDLTATQAKAILDTVATPSCRVYHNASQSIPNSTSTYLTFNSERWDNAGMHSTVTNPGRITIPVAGLYYVGGVVEYASAANGVRDLWIRLNGTTFINAVAFAVGAVASPFEMECNTLWSFAANDYIELGVLQTSGGAVNIISAAAYSAEFYAVRVGTV